MAETEPPRIEFPCEYPIKVMGRSVPEFESVVIEVFERHDPELVRERISRRSSREGTFISLTVVITATGKPQLEALHRELMSTGLVQMVI